MNMQIGGLNNFHMIIVVVYFTYFKDLSGYRHTHRVHVGA